MSGIRPTQTKHGYDMANTQVHAMSEAQASANLNTDNETISPIIEKIEIICRSEQGSNTFQPIICFITSLNCNRAYSPGCPRAPTH
jgi:hypothetical protein